MPKPDSTGVKTLILAGGFGLLLCLYTPLAFAKNSPPSIGTITPASGTSNSGQQVNFTTTFSDPDGYKNIQYANLLINSSLSGSRCFYGHYDQNTNTLSLRNDKNNAWLGGFTPGTNQTIENSYAKLDCSKTTISGQGANLTIKWAITFKPAFYGSKKSYLYVKDDANSSKGWLKKGSWRINRLPEIVSLNPTSDTSEPEELVYFTAKYSDPDGYKNIAAASFLINTSQDKANCLYAYYHQNEKKLYLADDNGNTWLGGFKPGSKKLIENSYAKIDCAKTKVSGSGSSLSVKWAVLFKPAFAGQKNTYLYVKDDYGAYTDWLQKGTWQITTNSAPQINSIIPSPGETFLVGAKVNIQVNASDPENNPLEYQFSIAGTVKQAWSNTNTYNWQTSAADAGSANLTCEVRDKKGAKAIQSVFYQIINPTVQEILQRIADNYGLINDKKMDVTMNSKFNSEPFGEAIYTCHYFKKPDKQRTDTFNKPEGTESERTEIQITKDSDIYIINPLTRALSHRNILSELNITQEQFNQMDEIYHLPEFLNAHNIIRIDNPNDLAKGLIMFEAIPKVPHNVYSKLGIQVDYFKGLRIRSQTYIKEENNQTKLKQSIETANSQMMANGTWVPTNQIKIFYVSNGSLVMTSDFTNISLNTGLPDYLFDPDKQ